LGHSHLHDARLEDIGRNRSRLGIVFAITISFAVVEVVGGVLSNSLALLSDAGHMVIDAAAIGLSLFALSLADKPSTAQKTYALVRMEIIAAFLNGLTLIALAGFIFYEAIERINEPPEIKGGLMMTVALIGMLVNIVGGWILWNASHTSLNVKGAFLHVMGDLAGSVGAVAAAGIVMLTGWTIADPLISIFIGCLIIYSSFGLLKETFHILMEGAPRDLDSEEITNKIRSVKGVKDVHDFHIWSLTAGVILLTAHVETEKIGDGMIILEKITSMLQKDYGLAHSTIQIEEPESVECSVSC